MNKKELPVLLLTGYLGSGKTTLLNRILTNKKGIKFAVVVNDIGEVNIDANLIQQGGVVNQKDDSLVALQNGCICCTLKMDLVEQLKDIAAMQRFDYIVIEASGICEPAPIAQTICSIPTLGPEYTKDAILRLDSIVTVVDALRMRDEFGSGEALTSQNIGEEDIENLVIQQIEFCNTILLNKASEVSAEELEKIKQIIHALQPKAEIITCDYGDVDLDKLVNTHGFDFDAVATSAAWIDEIEHHHEDDDDEEEEHHHHHHDDDDDNEEEHHHHHHDDDDDDEEEHHHHHHHHHHDHKGGEVEEYGIGSFVYYARKPFDINYFDNFVARQWPKGVIRCKGICWFVDEPDRCYVFEQAGRQMGLQGAGQWYATMPEDELRDMMAMNEDLRRDWNPMYGDRMQKLVFIGQHMDRKAITDALDFCLSDKVTW
ncbi:cobalamin biosynthesis protein CobW [Prevotella sp. P5-126]|uniref:GTP-binding protein n=1 Tax=unclassified Prevotella TaxID=2638335 RepID=UPI000B968CA9|nr:MULTISPECIES: GTP-binding protein [unclassified Prevotella]OYP38985.1 cobalamin biosynthesis protein CobW [Prevotella sp. P5-126]OYP45615.1 cobalamin biosynthesis protein CobW [Prevotella sp. P4-98]OYP46039.1 cobalamin biosynthesis protein CobW [Prevotella sp. P4-119]